MLGKAKRTSAALARYRRGKIIEFAGTSVEVIASVQRLIKSLELAES